MNRKLMVCLFSLFFSMKMVFCAEEGLSKKRKHETGEFAPLRSKKEEVEGL